MVDGNNDIFTNVEYLLRQARLIKASTVVIVIECCESQREEKSKKGKSLTVEPNTTIFTIVDNALRY